MGDYTFGTTHDAGSIRIREGGTVPWYSIANAYAMGCVGLRWLAS